MLVLKRALSLLLSFVLVYSPSLAFAKEKAKSRGFRALSEKRYVEEEKHEQKRQVAKAEKKAAREAAKQQRKLASESKPKTYKNMNEAIESLFHTVKHKGQEYTVAQVAGPGKTVKAQVVRGKDYQETLVDEFNTGTASRWEIKKGDLTITATHPFQGRFSQVDIAEPRAKSIVHAHLQLNPDLKTYRLANITLEPYEVAGDDSQVVIGCLNQLDPTITRSVSDLDELLKAIAPKDATPEKALACKLSRFQEMSFDKSCYDEPGFASSTKDMTAALAKVFSSNGSKSTPPRYLACLNEKGFAFNSAKMQGAFIGAKNTAVTQLTSTMNAGWSQAQVKADNSCEPMTEAEVYSGASSTGAKMKLFDFAPLGVKPFTCNGSMDKDGEFINGQIVLGRNSAQMAKAYKSDAVDAYASLMFHEMLHESGLGEDQEALVGNLQQCCAGPDPSSSAAKKACSAVDTFTAQQAKRQFEENYLGIFYPGYNDIHDHARLALGSQTDAFMGQWYDGLEKDPYKAAWNNLQICDQRTSSSSGGDVSTCNQSAYKELKKYNDSFFGSNCKAFSKTATNPIDCSSLRSQFDTALQNGTQVGAQGVAGTDGHNVMVIAQAEQYGLTKDSVTRAVNSTAAGDLVGKLQQVPVTVAVAPVKLPNPTLNMPSIEMTTTVPSAEDQKQNPEIVVTARKQSGSGSTQTTSSSGASGGSTSTTTQVGTGSTKAHVATTQGSAASSGANTGASTSSGKTTKVASGSTTTPQVSKPAASGSTTNVASKPAADSGETSTGTGTSKPSSTGVAAVDHSADNEYGGDSSSTSTDQTPTADSSANAPTDAGSAAGLTAGSYAGGSSIAQGMMSPIKMAANGSAAGGGLLAGTKSVQTGVQNSSLVTDQSTGVYNASVQAMNVARAMIPSAHASDVAPVPERAPASDYSRIAQAATSGSRSGSYSSGRSSSSSSSSAASSDEGGKAQSKENAKSAKPDDGGANASAQTDGPRDERALAQEQARAAATMGNHYNLDTISNEGIDLLLLGF